jgi:PAT family beta-lactamase induction signal transducer AmpG
MALKPLQQKSPPKPLLESLGLYLHPRILAIFFLGFSSGLPLLLTLSTLDIWLSKAGIDKTVIGLFAFVGIPYSLKFLWAPLIDQLSLPLFTRLFGRRRGWAILTQLCLMGAIFMMGQTDPTTNLFMTGVYAIIVAFCSASQDIVIDAYRVEILQKPQYGAGAGMIVAGYRVGMLMAGAGALYFASYYDWSTVYTIMAAFIGVGLITILLSSEPETGIDIRRQNMPFVHWVGHAVVDPFKDFVRRPGWAQILLFIILFKLGDAMLSKMASPFYIEMGFSLKEIANISKLYGTGATILGGMIGGVVVYRLGIIKGLWITGILQVLSNLVFAYQASVGHDVPTLAVTIGVENLSGGMGTAVFVAYLSSLCHVAYTATQYALLSALMSVPRTVLTAGSGYVAESVDWVTFFVFTALVAIPGLLLLLKIQKLYRREEREEGGLADT